MADLYIAVMEVTDFFEGGKAATRTETRTFSEKANLASVMKWAEEAGRHQSNGIRGDVRILVNEEEANRRGAEVQKKLHKAADSIRF